MSQIASVWQLELLLLYKNSDHPLSAQAAAKALYLSADILEPVIKRFVDAEFLVAVNDNQSEFSYEPKSEQTRKTIEELNRTYNQQRVNVINLIFARPINSFADSFSFKREDKE